MKQNTYTKIIWVLIFISSLWLNLNAQNHQLSNGKRGIVVYPSDIISIGAKEWAKFLSKNQLNLLGIHTDTRLETLPKLKAFLTSKEGQILMKVCKKRNIDVEFELHVLQNILPRSLFQQHPAYFRMDKNGKRQEKFNMCFTSDAAYDEIEKNIIEITKWLKPTTHRYFFWTDDVSDSFCNCDNCKHYSESEQALLYENKLLTILGKIDPLAQVAHLAYHHTLASPQKVKPLDGVFLEYAPISRDYSKELAAGDHLNHLQANLQVFPKETAHILEYWLDVSMFSGWKKNKLVKLPWIREYVRRDIEDYKSLGIKSITSFGAWINMDYINRYGKKHIMQVLNDYGQILLNP